MPSGNYGGVQPGIGGGGNYPNQQQYQQYYGAAGQNNYSAPQNYGSYGYAGGQGQQPPQGNDKN